MSFAQTFFKGKENILFLRIPSHLKFRRHKCIVWLWHANNNKVKRLKALVCVYCFTYCWNIVLIFQLYWTSFPLISSCAHMPQILTVCIQPLYFPCFSSCLISCSLLFLHLPGQMMMIRRVGAPGWPNFALTFSRNISTSAAWSGQNLVKRNAGTRLGKPCCRRPAESQSVLVS